MYMLHTADENLFLCLKGSLKLFCFDTLSHQLMSHKKTNEIMSSHKMPLILLAAIHKRLANLPMCTAPHSLCDYAFPMSLVAPTTKKLA
jgi:hypothetical protein